MNPVLEIILLFVLILINGFFALAETALVSSRKARLQQYADEKLHGAQTALTLTENPNHLLSTTQVGISLVATLTGAVGSATLGERLAVVIATIPALAPYSLGLAIAVIVLITTYFSLVIGELIPKRIALNNPERMAMAMAGPMKFLSTVTAPIIHFLSASTELGLRLLGFTPSHDPPVTQEEIRVMMEQGTQVGVFEEAEQDMIEGVFRLGDRYVDALMTPRTEIEWIDLDDSSDEIIQQIRESAHSRFPVAQDSLDNVQGILQARDLLADRLFNPEVDLQTHIEAPLFLPDSTSAIKALEQFKLAHTEVALVIDEYGGLLGMVTLYDILEAIVGELPITDDEEEPEIVRREDGSYLLDGLLHVDELKELLDIDELPEEERVGYQTIGGLMMSQLGAIPSSGAHFEYGSYRFEVVDMDGRRVDKVLVSRIPDIPLQNTPAAQDGKHS